MRDLFRMLESFNTAFRLKNNRCENAKHIHIFKNLFFLPIKTILIAAGLKVSDILKKIRLKFGMTT